MKNSLPADRISPYFYSAALEVFLAVCEHNSFTKAAQALGVSQSAISQHMTRLEGAIGFTLFDREIRPIKLTPEALQLQEHFRSQLSELEIVIDLIKTNRAIKRFIRFGIVDSLSDRLAPALVTHLSRYSDKISIMSGTSPNITNDLRNRDVDIIISSDPLFEVEGLVRHHLMSEPNLIVSAEPIPASDWSKLAAWDHPLIRYTRRSASGRMVETHFKRIRLDIPFSIEADTTRVVLELLKSQRGWAIVTPLCLLQCNDLINDLHISKTPYPGFNRELYLIYREGESKSLIDKVLVESKRIMNDILLPDLKALIPELETEITMTH